MQYRCETDSAVGFVQQLVNYLSKGYWFYVTGRIPAGKNREAIDRKIIDRYDIAVSQWARSRRKKAGGANVQYLRRDDFFIIIATHGRHRFFEHEAEQFKDAREAPIKFDGYSISYRFSSLDGSGHPHVRVDREPYKELKAHLVEMATRRDAAGMKKLFRSVPFEPYAPVRRQFLNILRAVNRARGCRGFSELPYSVIRFRRRIVKPFGESNTNKEAA